MTKDVADAIDHVVARHRAFQRAREKSPDALELVNDVERDAAALPVAERSVLDLCVTVAQATRSRPSDHITFVVAARRFRQLVRDTAGRGRSRTPRKLKDHLRRDALRALEAELLEEWRNLR